ncbi:hypothetical protein [Pseudomonas sp. RC10]|uniref:hypothetical protein n=1 Tax=Pseudomonas bambusae TaxID=3139142 RepID=UPI00313A47B5
MQTAIQIIRFNTATNQTEIQLNRHIDSPITSVEYVRDGTYVNRKVEQADTAAEAFSLGLAEIKGKISEPLVSVDIQHSNDILDPAEVKSLIIESGFVVPIFRLY